MRLPEDHPTLAELDRAEAEAALAAEPVPGAETENEEALAP